MPTTMFSWELIVEGSEARYYLESHATVQIINLLISKPFQPATKPSMRVVYGKLIK